MAINNRYEFMFFVECVNGNPNGDPDMGNSPRMDPQDMSGYITDVALKRRIRNYVQTAYAEQPGMNIIVQSGTNTNKFIAEVRERAGVAESAKDKLSIYKARQQACTDYYDVRTFGAVLSTGPNAGQVRGPVQLTFARSIDPILPLDISITRMATTNDKLPKTSGVAAYKEWEQNQSEDALRTMGRKQFISYGLYEARGFISANLAAETGFGDKDLSVLFEAILSMYEHDRSASKGLMSVISPLIIFRHTGTDSDAAQRVREAKLGCAPAHKLFETVSIARKEGVELPRSYRDYDAAVDLSSIPNGVDVGFLASPNGDIQWNALKDSDWLKLNGSR